MNPIRYNLPDDVIISILEMTEISSGDLKELAKCFSFGHSLRMNYLVETRRLIEAQMQHYLCNIRFKLMCLRDVPERHRTYEICRTAVQEYAYNIAYVPDNVKMANDFDLCRKAISYDGYNVRYLPKEIPLEKAIEFYKIAVESEPTIIRYLPEEYQCYEIYKIAVSEMGSLIIDVPEEFKTGPNGYELFKHSLKKDGLMLARVPESFRTKELYEIAFHTSPSIIGMIPKEFITPEMCKTAIEGFVSLECIPREMRTFELCKIAVSRDPFMLKYAVLERGNPNTYELCKITVARDPYMLSQIPEDILITERGYEVCKLAVEKNSYIIDYVPNLHQTLELWKLYVGKVRKITRNVPNEYVAELRKMLRN